MYVEFSENDGVIRAEIHADESNCDELAQWFELAFPQLDKWELANDFVSTAKQHGDKAHGYAIEQTQIDGNKSVATLLSYK